MIHPQHGATNVGQGEVAEHEKNGWKVATVDDWYRMSGKPQLCKDFKQEQPVEEKQAPKKRGPKPKTT